ncbi:hypothetical protein [Amycolatopsis sp. GM8]|uniref:hypothetical protein n=1 Tax=Amycolatopsis sp. GM8 TaxID=2896530 RepID=UPI001F462297|nr:hypothetical protein [Amycolatopsis sp. GM8]
MSATGQSAGTAARISTPVPACFAVIGELGTTSAWLNITVRASPSTGLRRAPRTGGGG